MAFIATVNVYGEVRVFHLALEFAKVRSASRALYHFDPILSMVWMCDKRIMHYLFQFLPTNGTKIFKISFWLSINISPKIQAI